MIKIHLLFSLLFSYLLSVIGVFSQAVPASDENIPYLVTFGKHADKAWGDDDFTQVFFFKVPKDFSKPLYFRIFDPECSGEIDEANDAFNTATRFSIYGGRGCITNEDAISTDPVGEFKSGNLLDSKVFASKTDYDNSWYTFGPFNPSEGEYSERHGGYIFKMITEGIKGDDGNLYRYFMSVDQNRNIPVEDGNAFCYEYTFRLHSDPTQVSHIYPYLDDKVIALKQSNFDWDSDGYITLTSRETKADPLEISGDNEFSRSDYTVKDGERGHSVDIAFKKNNQIKVNNNNVVFSVTNQYGELLPFYVVPIGGVPRYKSRGRATPIKR